MSSKLLPLSVLVLFIMSGTLFAQNEELGLASYYSDDFHGRSTAYGDVYNKNELTCAHKRYGYGTRLRITNLENNKSVVVKVIDKGPFIKGRVVDLSRRAAEVLGFADVGTAQVRVEAVGNAPIEKEESIVQTKQAPPPPKPDLREPESTPDTYQTSSSLDPRRNPLSETQTEEASNSAPDRETAPKSTAKPEAKTTTTKPTSEKAKVSKVEKDRNLIGPDDLANGVYQITLEKPVAGNYAVQVASFSNMENVIQRVAELQGKWFENILIHTENGDKGKLYRVLLGPFTDEKTAEHYQESLRKRYKISGFVTTLVKP